MNGLRAFRLALFDLWEESSFVVGVSLLGGVLSLLLLPLPFVLAAHYGTAERVGQLSVVSLRTWWQCGRAHARFFYKWFLLVTAVGLVLGGNFYFYQRFETGWAAGLRWLMAVSLVIWLLPQPLVPALYFQQTDRRLRVALRNGWVLCLLDPAAVLVLWLATLLLALPLAYVALPLLVVLPAFVAFLSTRVVGVHLKRPGTEA